ncbi:hypothetical protein FBALC1_03132 [Flavobacteriales bacterium ALC-1]|nr:hypothetical protein FBALC1_03132 [Flavobacteriales bacterium ALC-1]
MGNLAITYQHIADILSFETSTLKLEKTLTQPSFDWDAIVVEGSKHLVLPAIYCRLKAKQLLHVLPVDLINYLEHITSENRKRNSIILTQIGEISQLLNSHNIEFVFLKGAALLVLNCFSDIAERMLGDIDILVSPNQLNKAHRLLIDIGYKPIKQTLGNDFFEHKHLPRLKTDVSSNRIAAVEVHRKLFISFNYNALNPKSILKEQQENIFIPSLKHLLMHNILNYQINDKGVLYNSISFRSAYDTILLIQKHKDYQIWYNDKFFKSYFCYTSLFFQDIKTVTNSKSNYSTSFYLFKLRHLIFYKFWNRVLTFSNFLFILLNRLIYFTINKSYRKAIINDRKRIYTHFKSFFNSF